jgi:four helix bundle protein
MTFEDLNSWKQSRALVNQIYGLTRDLALSKDRALCSQIQRASVSMMSNIAEGFERTHLAEKLQAYNIARASCGEVRSLLYVIEDNYRTTAPVAVKVRAAAGEAGALISGLIASTNRRKLQPPNS